MVGSALVGSAAHIFCSDLEAPKVESGDLDHLFKSLRLRSGEIVTVSDGKSNWREFKIAASIKGIQEARSANEVGRLLSPTGPALTMFTSAPKIGVGFAFTGSSSAREVVQRLTEIGVSEICPITSARSSGKLDGAKASKLTDALARVAREASMQSRRVTIPEISEPIIFAQLVSRWKLGSAICHPGGRSYWQLMREQSSGQNAGIHRLIIGPEGGWTQAEVECGLPLVGLGNTVLRSETAAFVAGAILAAAWAQAT